MWLNPFGLSMASTALRQRRSSAPTGPGTGAGPTDFPVGLTVPTTWYYAAPPPFGNDGNNGLTALTPKTLKGAIQFAASGSGIWLADGRYSSAPQPGVADPNYSLPVKNLTIWAVNRGNWHPDPLGDGLGYYGPFFERKVIIDGLWQFPVGSYYKFGYVKWSPRDCFSGYPNAFAGETWFTVGLGQDATYNNPILRGEQGSVWQYRCEGFHGYGVDQQPFDHTRKYDEFRSPGWFKFYDGTGGTNVRKIYDNTVAGTGLQGWGDADWCEYNTLMWGPSFAGKYFKDFIMIECHVHDIASGLASVAAKVAGGNLLIQNNVFERVVLDFKQTAIENASFASIIKHGNIHRDCIGYPKDACNPHNDLDQDYSNIIGGTVAAPIPLRNIQVCNEFHCYSPGGRAKPQGDFHQTSADHQVAKKAVYLGKRVRNNVLIGVYRGYQDEGSRDLYYRGNITINPVGFDIAGNVQPADFQSLRLRYNPGPPTLVTDAGPSKGLLINNIVEGISGDALMANVGTINTGYQGAQVPFSQIFANANNAAGHSTFNAWWQAIQRLPDYAARGPQYPSLRAFLAQPLDWTGERPWVGFVDTTAQPLSTLVTSNTAFIHGGDDGDLLNMTSFPAGAQWRMLDIDETTVLKDWSSDATGTLTVAKFMQLRLTTPATNSTPASISFNVGAYPMTWAVSTVSANKFPETTFAGNARLRMVNSTSAGMTSSKTVWFYFRGKLAASQNNALANLAIGNTGAAMFGQINFSAVNKINFSFKNAAGTTVVSSGVTINAVARDGATLVEVLIAVDTSQDSWDLGVQVYQRINEGAWASVRPLAAATFTKDELIDFQSSGASKDIYFLGSPTSNYTEGEFQALALGTGALDITNSAVRELFSADNIGKLAKGPNGIQPYFFFVGNKTKIESFNANLGSIVRPVTKDGSGTLTAGPDQTWPVPVGTRLTLSPGPYAVGVPITVTALPLGYLTAGETMTLSSAGGTFDSATKAMTEGSAGATFTFTPTSPGPVTISGDMSAVDAAHTDPTPASLTVG